jgi:hypothetical protein
MNTTIIKEKDEKTVYNIVVDYYNSASAYIAENLFFVFISVIILILIAVITLAMIRSSKHKDSELLKLLEEEEIRAEQELREGIRAFEARKTQVMIYLLVGYAIWYHMGHTYAVLRNDSAPNPGSALADNDKKLLFFINLLGNNIPENHQPYFVDVQGVDSIKLPGNIQKGSTAISASDFIDAITKATGGAEGDHELAIKELISMLSGGIQHIHKHLTADHWNTFKGNAAH